MKKQISTIKQVKTTNVSRIKSALKQLPQGTKTTIAQITGLSVATCNTILNELEESGEILEVSYVQPTIGRPPKSYKFNENFAFVCCVHITKQEDGRNLHYSIMNLLGKVFINRTIHIAHATYDVIFNVLSELIKEYPLIQIISIGVPGVVHNNTIKFSNIKELNVPALAEKLEHDLKRNVIIENDMNAIAYGFYYDGMTDENNSLVMMSFFRSTCPGAGIIVDGAILRGSTNFAGEISHFPSHNTIPWEEIKRDSEKLALFISSVTIGIITILNPEVIILTGRAIDEEVVDTARKLIAENIPEEHLVPLEFVENTTSYYVKGLMAIAFERLNEDK